MQEEEYLKNLLGKKGSNTTKANSYLKTAQAGYVSKIKAGKYQIKQGTSIPHRQMSNLSRKDTENLKGYRKNLQQNLQLIDSRIGELTQPNQKSKSIDEQERRKFVSSMVKARKQLQRKRQSQFQQQQKRQQQEKQKSEEEEKKKIETERQKRRLELMKKSQSMEVVRKNKKEQIEKQNKILKEKIQEKILSERMIEKFKKNEALDLQDRKKKLAEIRSLHQPITKSEFQTHLQKLDKLKSQQSRINESMSRYTTANTNKFYKSSWYKKQQNVKIKFQNQIQEEELEHVKDMKDKLKKYGEYVRQNFKPEVSLKKSKDLGNRNKSMPPNIKNEDLRELGLKYLEYSKSKRDPNKKSNEEDEEKQERSNISKPKNYLEEFKKNHKSTNPKAFIDKIQNNPNMSSSEKATKILNYVSDLERKAKMKEQKDKINKIAVDEDLDNLYMEAIAAKLSMLGENQSLD